jgi:hypothetical protein
MSLVLTYDPVLSRIRLAGTALGASADHALVWRSTDNFKTYQLIRGADPAAVAGGVLNIDDYEFEAGVPIAYQMTSYNSGGVQQASFTTAITQDLDSAWLKVPAAPYLNRRIEVQDKGPVTRRSRAGVFDIKGRSFPVSVGDVASSREWTLYVSTEDAGEETALDYLVASGEVVFLHLPLAAENLVYTGYYSLGDVSRQPPMRLSPRRIWTFPLVEVARPGNHVVGPAYTWASLLAEYGSWTNVISGNATWADVLNRVASPSDVIVP